MDVRTLCLGVLSLEDASGYEIKQTLEDVFGSFYNASFGSIYPALARLVDEGEATVLAAGDARFPDRKRYRITETGRSRLSTTLAKTKGRDVLRSEFLVAMFFAHLLPVAELRRLTDEKLAEARGTQSVLQSYSRVHLAEGQRFALRYMLALAKGQIEFLEGEGRAIVQAMVRERQALGVAEYDQPPVAQATAGS
ncbi:MAG: helix-turn-helix transcriptional regulator [Rhodospirillaceae bacterium]|nr:helix-turn-helix transcriptional regulator [Rhodospirillaceae bacterium]